jgi:2-polyprenyl-3-methyl-5-hydroxy-6-metoxy-1,4-benzoquinol methylase
VAKEIGVVMSDESVRERVDVGPAARRWQELVERRRRQMDDAYASIGRNSKDYWALRVGRASGLRRRAADDDRLLQMLLACASQTTTVLDVGAGAGRYTRALASHVARVTAVEPDAAMAGLLERAIAEEELGNVDLIRAAWQDAEVEPCDVVLCTHVLYPIAEPVSFVRKLDAHARRACFLALRETAPEPEPLSRLWRHYHGEPRFLQPGFLEAYNLLHELGIYANVRILRVTGSMWSFEDLDQAVATVHEHLILPEGAEIDAHLRRELEQSLVRDGEWLTLPMQPPPSAILWWEK